jgi:hypothetical protein
MYIDQKRLCVCVHKRKCKQHLSFCVFVSFIRSFNIIFPSLPFLRAPKTKFPFHCANRRAIKQKCCVRCVISQDFSIEKHIATQKKSKKKKLIKIMDVHLGMNGNEATKNNEKSSTSLFVHIRNCLWWRCVWRPNFTKKKSQIYFKQTRHDLKFNFCSLRSEMIKSGYENFNSSCLAGPDMLSA